MNRIALFLLIILLASACAPAGHSNVGFKSDMNQFLGQYGVSTTDLKCSMLGNGVNVGPEAYCLLSLTQADVDAVVNQLGLRQKTDIAVSWQPTGADCWTRLDFHDPLDSQWYLSEDNASNLVAENGVHFVYFRLFYKPDSSEGCISTSYVPPLPSNN
ncbi:MAG: hypothetical protein LCI00_07510 [Chloroflexi bacterium]|nr:hypothetical protein [Chloroflexota bacterium]MCC6894629.1 hypothetical protein [Anaerolineae bacterium]